nr:uncharacterized protein LOC111504544 isoform X1 [Leptinotarsa decemlineata]
MAVDEKEHKGHRERGEKRVQNVQDSKDEHWRSAFPPNITVDELWLYRKRKPSIACVGDNLKIGEGSFQFLKTEYRRRFKNFYETLKTLNEEQKDLLTTSPIRPQSSLKLEGTHDFQSNYNESFRKHSTESLSDSVHEIIDGKHMENETANRLSTSLEFLGGPRKFSRKRRLHKRLTNLEIQGDYSHITEHAEKFIGYLLEQRAKLCRTPTTLKLEGDMETKTETSTQYINFDKFDRAPLCKKFTQLHLEGDLDILTEKQAKFVPFEISKRPPLVKKSTNLHLEGDQFLIPEYRHQYVFYNSLERPKLILPLNNLKPGGMFEDETAGKQHERNMHPLIPFLRDSDGKPDDNEGRRRRHVSTSSHFGSGFLDSGTTGNVLTRVSSHPNLGTSQAIEDGSGKTKKLHQQNAYIDYDFDKKPPASRRSRKEGLGLSYMKGDGAIDAKPEYSRAFVDFPRQRPSVKRPTGHLISTGEGQYVTEKKDKFIPHGTVEKTVSCRRKPELKMEGRFECQPEYRKAYIDYLIREKKPPLVKVTRAVEETDTNDVVDPIPSEVLSETTEKAGKPEPSTLGKRPSNLNVLLSPSSAASSHSARTHSPRVTKKIHRNSSPRVEAGDFGLSQSSIQPRKISPRRSLTPSPRLHQRVESKRENKGISTGVVKGSWRPAEKKGSISSDTDGWYSSSEADPAFFILDDRTRRTSFRNNLYKEQKWMPSWYSVQ